MDPIADLPPHAIRHSEQYIFADTLDIDHGKSNILPKYSKINYFFPHLYSLSQYWHVLTNLHPVNHHLPWGRLATTPKFHPKFRKRPPIKWPINLQFTSQFSMFSQPTNTSACNWSFGRSVPAHELPLLRRSSVPRLSTKWLRWTAGYHFEYHSWHGKTLEV